MEETMTMVKPERPISQWGRVGWDKITETLGRRGRDCFRDKAIFQSDTKPATCLAPIN
jgi:hypothetical protein